MNAAFLISAALLGQSPDLLGIELAADAVALVEYRGHAIAGHSPTIGSISVVNYLMGLKLRVIAVQRGDLLEDTLVVVGQPRGPKFADVVFGDEAGVLQPGEQGLTRPPWERSRHVLDIGDRFVAYLVAIPPEERSRVGFRIVGWIPATGQQVTSAFTSNSTMDGLEIRPTLLSESLRLRAFESNPNTTDN